MKKEISMDIEKSETVTVNYKTAFDDCRFLEVNTDHYAKNIAKPGDIIAKEYYADKIVLKVLGSKGKIYTKKFDFKDLLIMHRSLERIFGRGSKKRL